jgi:transcriptional regulator with XRE-family HTH domain
MQTVKARVDIGGDQIRLGRLALRWTQSDLSEKSGISRATISDIEGGQIEKTWMGTMRSLVRALERGGIEFSEDGVRVVRR